MSLRYQKRVNLGKGLGLNVSQSGISASYRSRWGSVGSRGFSFKTGIPGLSYRGSLGKNFWPAVLACILLISGVLVIYNLVRLIRFGLVSLYEFVRTLIVKKDNVIQEQDNPTSP